MVARIWELRPIAWEWGWALWTPQGCSAALQGFLSIIKGVCSSEFASLYAGLGLQHV